MFCYKSVNPASHAPITRLCPAISILTTSRTLSGAADPLKDRLQQTEQDNDGTYPISRKAQPIMLKILPIMLLSNVQKSSPLCSMLCP